jgi:hypothetical protein
VTVCSVSLDPTRIKPFESFLIMVSTVYYGEPEKNQLSGSVRFDLMVWLV